MLNLINDTDSIITVFNSRFFKNIEAGESLNVTDEQLGCENVLYFKDLSMNAERIEDNLQADKKGARFSWHFTRESSFPFISSVNIGGVNELRVLSSSQRFIPFYKLLRVKITLCSFSFIADGTPIASGEDHYIDKVDRTSVVGSLFWDLLIMSALLAFMLFASVTAIIESLMLPLMLLVFAVTVAIGFYVYHLARNFYVNIKRTVKDYPQYKSRFD